MRISFVASNPVPGNTNPLSLPVGDEWHHEISNCGVLKPQS